MSFFFMHFFLVISLWCLPLLAMHKPIVDHYEVLGLPVTATSAQITKAYRAISLKVHPDKNKAADAEETFKKVGAAYEVLSDDHKRKMFDDMLKAHGRYFSRTILQPAAGLNSHFARKKKQAKAEPQMPKPKTFFWGNKLLLGLTGLVAGGLCYWYLSSKRRKEGHVNSNSSHPA